MCERVIVVACSCQCMYVLCMHSSGLMRYSSRGYQLSKYSIIIIFFSIDFHFHSRSSTGVGEFLFKSDRSVEITHAIETVVGAMAKDKQKSTRGAKVGLHMCSFVSDSSIAAQSSALKTGTLGWATWLHIEHVMCTYNIIRINTAEPCYSVLTNKHHGTCNDI